MPHRIIPDTPVERHGGILVKRDDLYTAGTGSYGGKVRTCAHLAYEAVRAGATGLVTAGSRHSPQVNIVAGLCAAWGLRCRVHVPAGPDTPEIEAAAAAGAEVIRHRPGYNSVIVKRAEQDIDELNAARNLWRLIPFGMETQAAIEQTAGQVPSLHDHLNDIERIVVPVGSGMSLAGILTGLDRCGWAVPLVGVQVGADPHLRLNRYGPLMWPLACQLERNPLPYGTDPYYDGIGDLLLDPVYEAHCVPYLLPGDLLWCVGRRETATGAPRRPRLDLMVSA